MFTDDELKLMLSGINKHANMLRVAIQAYRRQNLLDKVLEAQKVYGIAESAGHKIEKMLTDSFNSKRILQ